MKARYLNNCVSWPSADVHTPGGLCEMIDAAQSITRQAFRRRVDRASREEIERQLGYAPHDPGAVLTMARDFHISYYRSVLHGAPCWFFKWSAIEYVFQ